MNGAYKTLYAVLVCCRRTQESEMQSPPFFKSNSKKPMVHMSAVSSAALFFERWMEEEKAAVAPLRRKPTYSHHPFAPHGHLPSSEEVDGLVKQARASPGGAFPTSGKKFLPPIRLSSTSFMPMKIWGKGQKFHNQ